MDDAVFDDHLYYSDWDAAYVLGSLSREERREYEDHLNTCERCQSAIGRLASLPGLLSKLDPVEAMAILDEGGRPLPLPEISAPHRRRVSARVVAGGLAAAAILVVAILVPTWTSSHQPTNRATDVTLSQTTPSALRATVALTAASWGTRVDMTCTYAATYGGPDRTYQLYVLDRSGHASLVSSWRSGPGDVAHTIGSTDLSPSQISAVQVRDVRGAVLLTGAVNG